MNVDQDLPTRTTTSSTHHDPHLPRDDNPSIERHVPDSYHHSSYEYLSSGNGLASVPSSNHPFNSSNNLSTPHPISSQKYPSKTVTSNSYSPTSYRYQAAAVLDEHPSINRSTTTTNPHHFQQQQQQQLSTSSLSAYVPHHLNPNRYSGLATTSDDSGNESSVNYQQQQQQLTSAANANTHFVVVAIDFGTTFSGYAFAFTRDIDSILMMRKVDGNDPGACSPTLSFDFGMIYIFVSLGVINQKTPTTILLTPNLEFHSFGFFARDFFHDLDPEEAKRWLYFEKFKMHLHYTQVSQVEGQRSHQSNEIGRKALFVDQSEVKIIMQENSNID